MELYPHQQVAVDKFVANYVRYPNVLIGDDMGLGKTVTAIALDLKRREHKLGEARTEWLNGSRKMTLVVSLKSMLGTWESHFEKWAPGLKVLSLSTTERSSLCASALSQRADVFIVNWDALRLAPELRKVRWLHIIGDEVQKIKNRKAQVTLAYKAIRSLFLTDMSGTWADNKPDDGWSILNHLYPRTWSSYWAFYNRHVIFRTKINPKTGQSFREILGVADEDALQKAMEPFYIRRLKTDVGLSLPDKTYTQIRVRLSAQQQRAYDAMRRDMLAWVGKNESDVLAAPVVIAKLLRLQQLAVAYGEMRVVKMRKWVKASDWGPTDENAMHRFNPKTGEEEVFVEVSVKKLFLTDPSTKLDAVMEILEQMPEKDGLVVFGQSKQAIYLLAERLKKAGISYGLLTGDVHSAAERDRLVNDFQAGKFRVFAGTIKAGGVGITLHRANRMVFLDRDWSPSVNRQAEDRIHRIGQKRNVQIIDLIGEGTIDGGRLQDIDLKWEWLKKILGDKSTTPEVAKQWA